MGIWRTKAEIVVGPNILDINSIGLDGQRLDLATAFYTSRILSKLSIEAKYVRLYFRLDTNDLKEWISGSIDPEALCSMAASLTEGGSEVQLFVGPNAHAKVYVGDKAALVGSANLTVNGLGGGEEILARFLGRLAVEQTRLSLDEYARNLRVFELNELREFVEEHRAAVRRAKKRKNAAQDRMPRVARDSIDRYGSYDDFLNWLEQIDSDAGALILGRARGVGQLSGHILHNFYGLRQFLIANPQELRNFSRLDENAYRLSSDGFTEAMISDFVAHDAVDESRFRLNTWKTYLPRECGGRAGRHGGTIGNLNRMLPLVSKYLQSKLLSSNT